MGVFSGYEGVGGKVLEHCVTINNFTDLRTPLITVISRRKAWGDAYIVDV